MRPFHLYRSDDFNGVSGTGYVAEGVQFTDGTVAVRWLTDTPSTNLYTSIEDVQKIHGHDGKTEVVWRQPHHTGPVMALVSP